jgi:hypothetical protein
VKGLDIALQNGVRQGGSRLARMFHLSDDRAVAKMGHPISVIELDVGHPSECPFMCTDWLSPAFASLDDVTGKDVTPRDEG